MLDTPHVNCDTNRVYEPSEDSFLLLDALEADLEWLKQRVGGIVPISVEVGCGSGIVSTFMMKHGIPGGNTVYLGTDVNPWALEATLETRKRNECNDKVFDAVQCDLTRSLRDGVVDLLVFNPPYVPAESVPRVPLCKEEARNDDDWLFLALDGGDDGMEVTNRLLEQLDTALSSSGVAYVLFCARNKPDKVAELMKSRGWHATLVEHRKAGWEVLSVYKFFR
ncbi:MTS domain-containing protein [Kluyveromyces marxianus]